MDGSNRAEAADAAWTFWRGRDGCWRWRQTSRGGFTRVGAVRYRGLQDCMGNAIYHGYVPPSFEPERHRA